MKGERRRREEEEMVSVVVKEEFPIRAGVYFLSHIAKGPERSMSSGVPELMNRLGSFTCSLPLSW